jgi:hypothetical protein
MFGAAGRKSKSKVKRQKCAISRQQREQFPATASRQLPTDNRQLTTDNLFEVKSWTRMTQR